MFSKKNIAKIVSVFLCWGTSVAGVVNLEATNGQSVEVSLHEIYRSLQSYHRDGQWSYQEIQALGAGVTRVVEPRFSILNEPHYIGFLVSNAELVCKGLGLGRNTDHKNASHRSHLPSIDLGYDRSTGQTYMRGEASVRSAYIKTLYCKK